MFKSRVILTLSSKTLGIWEILIYLEPKKPKLKPKPKGENVSFKFEKKNNIVLAYIDSSYLYLNLIKASQIQIEEGLFKRLSVKDRS